ncbi:polyprenyl synthetase family protein [Streptomyces cyaneofuscatus]|uniref:polyprenyl synthetase family protein n=1 Tax=Streptomyces cyaneofuscatus TaxID=66883 RepID=UPI00364EB724
MAKTVTQPPPNAASRVDHYLRLHLESKIYNSVALNHLARSITSFTLNGGKRIRPLMCCLGYRATTTAELSPAVERCAAAIELFHAFALIHDDIIDKSDSRRGLPTLQHTLADRHADRGIDSHDGMSKAILAGDMALIWADELFQHSGISDAQRTAAQPVWDALRAQVIAGQYLDVDATGRLDDDLDAAMRIIRYKTAKYTVEQPLLLGASLAGASRTQAETLSAFGLLLGEAFQLRDDLLGVFGTPEVTGKSRLDDLREGKRTPLIAVALRDAPAEHRSRLLQLLGNPDLSEDDAAEVRHILRSCGARESIENMINERRNMALVVVSRAEEFHAPSKESMRDLVDQLTHRSG